MVKRMGVLGSGVVGRTLSEGFLKHGYEVMLGTRDPGKGDVPQWLQEHPGAKAGTFRETAIFGGMIVLAVAGKAVTDVVALAGPDHFADKIVIDTTNPIADAPPVDGVLQFSTGPNESLGEAVQALLPMAHVVKAFNSVGVARMVNPKFEQGTPTMFVCGNHDGAKRELSGILTQFGWEAYDCGGMRAARAIEPLCMLWCIRGFRDNQWGHAFKLLTR
jgi:8-hydroxy-5-deazaflavin:NADPH oxidoreductase